MYKIIEFFPFVFSNTINIRWLRTSRQDGGIAQHTAFLHNQKNNKFKNKKQTNARKSNCMEVWQPRG